MVVKHAWISLLGRNFSYKLCIYLYIGIITDNPLVVWVKITLPTRGLKSVT